jgi:acetylornithine deacetylase/succinyl-diaminopimelate desuccinylase-like protein
MFLMKKQIQVVATVILLIAASWQASAQTSWPAEDYTTAAFEQLVEFVRIPNDALDLADIRRNVSWAENEFLQRGFTTRVLETSNTPLFLAELQTEGAEETLLFYMHLDGQSVDSAKWDQNDPYQPVLKRYQDGAWVEVDRGEESALDSEWRLFGRSASDDKGPIIMFLASMDMLSDLGKSPAYNIKVVLDGEEERGSTQLPAAVEEYKDLLAADHMIINDGPMHLSGRPTVVYGCRGLARVVLTVYGPRTHQHSGHYGNYAPNPAFRMGALLASMKDKDGRVVIPGYYDGIELDAATRRVLSAVPDDPDVIHQTIGIAEPEKVGSNYQESLQYPSLNVRGLAAAWTGPETRTIVPQSATAEIDIRLVPESDPDRLVDLVRHHIESEGYFVTDQPPTEEERARYTHIARLEYNGATLPFRTELDSTTGHLMRSAIRAGLDENPVDIRIMGGTVPISTFINALGIPAVIVPLVNADNNQHSPNENLRIGNITNGIATFASLLAYRPED